MCSQVWGSSLQMGAVVFAYREVRPNESVIADLADPTCVNFPLVIRDKDVTETGAALDERTKPRVAQYEVTLPDNTRWVIALDVELSDTQIWHIAKRAVPAFQSFARENKAALVVPGWTVLADPPTGVSDRDALALAMKLLSTKMPDTSGECGSLSWFWYSEREPILTEAEYTAWASVQRRAETLEAFGIALAIWAGIFATLYAIGWLIGWVVRGFHKQ